MLFKHPNALLDRKTPNPKPPTPYLMTSLPDEADTPSVWSASPAYLYAACIDSAYGRDGSVQWPTIPPDVDVLECPSRPDPWLCSTVTASTRPSNLDGFLSNLTAFSFPSPVDCVGHTVAVGWSLPGTLWMWMWMWTWLFSFLWWMALSVSLSLLLLWFVTWYWK